MRFETTLNWLFNDIQSLVVLTEKWAFFNKQLQEVYCILNFEIYDVTVWLANNWNTHIAKNLSK